MVEGRCRNRIYHQVTKDFFKAAFDGLCCISFNIRDTSTISSSSIPPAAFLYLTSMTYILLQLVLLSLSLSLFIPTNPLK